MVQLSLFAFLGLLEILAVLLVFVGFLVWRLWSARRRDRIQFIDAGDHHPTPSLYLDSEAARTRTFVTGLSGKPQAEPAAPALRAALAARAGLLRYESEVARRPGHERDVQAWLTLAQAFDAKLCAEGYSAQPIDQAPVYGDDSATREVMIAQQTRTIEHLREYIEQLLHKLGQEVPDLGVSEHLARLEQANRELNQCVLVLEDENGFLRDQIAALLKIDQARNGSTATAVKP